MNKNYRILWCEAHRQWVVAGELAGAFGKGKANGNMSRLVCAALLLGGYLAAGPQAAWADSCPIAINNITTTISSQCIVSTTDSVTVSAAGTLQNGVPNTLSVDAAATGVVIDNSGQITNTANPAISIDAAATGTQITNQAGAMIAVSTTNASSNTAIVQSGAGADVTLTNHGTISAVVSNTSTDDATALGVILNSITAPLTNTGTISAAATRGTGSTNSIDVVAKGIVTNTLSGTLDNSGTIRATAVNDATNTSSSISLTAIGLGVNTLSGTLTNSGLIEATATNNGDQSTNSVVSLQVVGVNVSGALSGQLSVTSTGTIRATATNNGSITSSASTRVSISALGVNIGGSLTGSLSNAGTISATVANNGNNSSSSISFTAQGVSIGGDVTGTLSNAGTISATAINNAAATSVSSVRMTSITGLFIGGSLTGTLSNTGTISATATNSGPLSSSVRMTVRALSLSSLGGTGTLINSGTISATALNQGTGSTGSVFISATGILIGGIAVGTSLANSGTISASASQAGQGQGSSTLSLSAIGLKMSFLGSLDGTISNTGTISASAKAFSSATAHTSLNFSVIGVSLRDVSGSLSNSGMITATAVNQADGTRLSATRVAGIRLSNLSGTLTNTGTVSASFSNSGSLTSSLRVNVNALSVVTNLSGTLTNNGTLSASATNNAPVTNSSSVSVNGLRVSTLTGTGQLTNTGTITASATVNGAAATPSTVGALTIINMQAGAIVNNSGTISATASNNPAKAFSLFVQASTGGTINNLAGGLLKGNLAVSGTAAVNNAGTIEIPDGVSGNIADNYTQQAGGQLRIGASSAASFGKLVVGGTADLTASGKLDVNVAGANTLAVGNTLTGVLTAGTLNVGAAGVTVTDNSALFNFTGTVDGAGTGIDLVTAASVSVATSTQATGLASASGAARVLDTLVGGASASADMAKVITALGKLSSQQQVSNAVAQTLPLVTGGVPLLGLGNSHGVGATLLSKTAAGSGLSAGDGFFSDGTLWIRPFASLAHQNDRNGASGFDANSYGLMAGADRDLGENSRLGLAFAWASSSIDSNAAAAPQGVDVNSFQLAAAFSYDLDPATSVNLSANGGVNLNDGRRIVSFGGLNRLASSNYKSWTAHAGVSLERRYPINHALTLRPSVRADYAVIHDQSYSESGAGALNLNVNSHNTDELLLGADAKLDYAVSKSTLLTASIGGAYDALSERASSTSAFAGAPGAAFTTRGIDPPSLVGRGGLRLTVKADRNLDISAGYNAEFRNDFIAHSGSIKLKWTF